MMSNWISYQPRSTLYCDLTYATDNVTPTYPVYIIMDAKFQDEKNFNGSKIMERGGRNLAFSIEFAYRP